ncbi:MAG: class I SAM-dependent methyltransferase [Planctomycetota bacterium]
MSQDTTNNPIYDPQFVSSLFDEMARTYGIVNLISSFGFAKHWRHQCVAECPPRVGSRVLDLMTGMGELCPELAEHVTDEGTIEALDISAVMCERLRTNMANNLACEVCVCEADVLSHEFEPESFDYVFSSFGLKTFSPKQIERLAAQVHRLLKPGGRFSMLEISVPPGGWIRWPYMFYLHQVIPWIGQVFMGNADNYRMLGRYTQAFEHCDQTREAFTAVGLDTTMRSYFFGCATGVVGRKSPI